jgi:hypothetical protein
MPNSFSVAFEGHFAHAISRPFRANRFLGCFPGLKPWAEWREDKECMGSFRPETEGHENLAQGFNP